MDLGKESQKFMLTSIYDYQVLIKFIFKYLGEMV